MFVDIVYLLFVTRAAFGGGAVEEREWNGDHGNGRRMRNSASCTITPTVIAHNRYDVSALGDIMQQYYLL